MAGFLLSVPFFQFSLPSKSPFAVSENKKYLTNK